MWRKNIPKHWCFERQSVSECATYSHQGKNLETAPNWHWNSQKRRSQGHTGRGLVLRVGVYRYVTSAGVSYLADGCADAVGRQAERRVNGSGRHGGAGRQLRLAELRLYVERRRSAVGRAGDGDRVVGGSHRRGANRVAVLLLLSIFHCKDKGENTVICNLP